MSLNLLEMGVERRAGYKGKRAGGRCSLEEPSLSRYGWHGGDAEFPEGEQDGEEQSRAWQSFYDNTSGLPLGEETMALRNSGWAYIAGYEERG